MNDGVRDRAGVNFAAPVASAIILAVIAVIAVSAVPVSAEPTAAPVVFDQRLPDLDRRVPAMLDVVTGELATAPRPEMFQTEAEYKAALAPLGDLAYENADGGLLFVGSGFAIPLGPDDPDEATLASLPRRLLTRDFIRGAELASGSWFAALTRSGEVVIGRVVSRNSVELRLRWVSPLPEKTAERVELISRIAAVSAPNLRTAFIPELNEAGESVLRLANGKLIASPPLAKSVAADRLGELVAQVAAVGDLAYARSRAGMLIIGSGRAARVATGPVASLSGRDLRSRLRDRSIITTSEIETGAVFLIEQTDGRYALLRVDAVKSQGEGDDDSGDHHPAGMTVTWISQSDGSAVFSELAAFDATYLIPDQTELDRLLLSAAARGDAEATRRLLSMGAEPNAKIGRDGRPPLVHSVISGDGETFRLLLDAGADPNGSGEDGWNALHVAVRLKRKELVDVLLEAGVNVETKTADGTDPLQIAIDTRHPDAGLIARLRALSNGPDSLGLAAQVGDLEALMALLDGTSQVDRVDEKGRTALQIAATSGQVEALRALLEAGADPRRESGPEGSAILAAARAEQIEAVAVLLKHDRITETQKASALYAANANGSPELALLLLESGADPGLNTTQGPTALDHALRYGSDALIDVYLEQGHALTVAAAARLGRVEDLAKMLEDGAQANPHPATQTDRTPLHVAIENDQTESLRVLLDHGVDPSATLPTWDQRSPLHEAARRRSGGLAALLIERGADPNPVDRVGRTPLYEAVALGREGTARVLLENGADPNLAPEGEAILDFARSESLRSLLEEYGAKSEKSATTSRR